MLASSASDPRKMFGTRTSGFDRLLCTLFPCHARSEDSTLVWTAVDRSLRWTVLLLPLHSFGIARCLDRSRALASSQVRRGETRSRSRSGGAAVRCARLLPHTREPRGFVYFSEGLQYAWSLRISRSPRSCHGSHVLVRESLSSRQYSLPQVTFDTGGNLSSSPIVTCCVVA